MQALFPFLCILLVGVARADYFLHFSDTHLDLDYAEGSPVECLSSDVGLPCCHSHDIGSGSAGHYGEVSCDASHALMGDILEEMHKLYPDPDFIAFTGDIMCHSDVTSINSKIIDAWNSLYDALEDTFPGVPVYSSMGNHDTYPVDILRPNGEEKVVSDMADVWSRTLSDTGALETASAYGYYSTVLPSNPKIRIISMNLMYTLKGNFEVDGDDPDPAGQKAWLYDTLVDVAAKQEIPLLLLHGPLRKDTKSNYTEWFTGLLDEFTTTGAGAVPVYQLGGHTHYDELQFYRPSIGASSQSYMHLVPQTAFRQDLWPSVSVWVYDNIESMELGDMLLYHVNVTRANSELHITPELFYSTRDTWGIPDLTLKSWDTVVERLRVDESTAIKYLTIMNTDPSLAPQSCDLSCRHQLYCEVAYPTTDLIVECRKSL
ncbi:sphingomyelin phosphodiesterase [Pelomyxa schiedti]|nr:sphingomyelin phosphodiesterase [Pelomyxa schiedti]